MNNHTPTTKKVCTGCNELLPVAEFNKCKSARDGLQWKCKACLRAYRQKPERKSARREYMREYMREYQPARLSDPAKREAYNAYMREYMREYNAKPGNDKKVKARGHISSLIKSGIIRPAAELDCAGCGQPADQYHHEDYDRPFLIEPLCLSCHAKKRHKLNDGAGG